MEIGNLIIVSGVIKTRDGQDVSASGFREPISQASPVLSLGMAVYRDGSIYRPASSETETTIGSAIVAQKSGNNYVLVQAGFMSLTEDQWDVVTGESGGLTINAEYYSNISGLISTSPGNILNPVLTAYSSTDAFVWPAIRGADAGSGQRIKRNVYSGDNTNDTFNLTATEENLSNLMIFVDDVLQVTNFTIQNGNQVVFDTPPGSGTDNIVIYHFIDTPFVEGVGVNTHRVEFSLSDSGSTSINSIFGSKETGFYHMFETGDASHFARIYYTSSTEEKTLMEANDSFFTNVKDSNGFVNIYFESSDLQIQNLTGTVRTFVIRKET